jgi:predicted Holliday junction resolvase-like endonuclease
MVNLVFPAFSLLLVIILAYVIFNLVEKLYNLKAKIKIKDEQIKNLEISRSNLDDMLDVALNGQIELLKFIDNFRNFTSEHNRKVIDKWRTDILRTKEIYVDRWRAKDKE